MELARIITIFLSAMSFFVTVASFLWGVYIHLRKRGYRCVCCQTCTSCIQACTSSYQATSPHTDLDVDEDVIMSRLSAHLDIKETWV